MNEPARELTPITDADLDRMEARLQKTVDQDHGDYIPDWLADTIRSLSAEVRRLRDALEVALPLVRGRSCWHDDPEEPDCCEHGFIAAHMEVALGYKPHPLYAKPDEQRR